MTIPITTTTKVFPKKNGRDFNFYAKKSISSATFGATGSGSDGYSVDGYAADMVITFPVQTIYMLNEGTTSGQVIEYSFNGNTVHGELDPSLPSRSFTFENRPVGEIWFRVKSGSTGSISVRVDAWGNR